MSWPWNDVSLTIVSQPQKVFFRESLRIHSRNVTKNKKPMFEEIATVAVCGAMLVAAVVLAFPVGTYRTIRTATSTTTITTTTTTS